ncbi:uncharacterized protein EHS24_005112 [Apiotrichum porosum]|uniref:Uncharacterized protein n=1 Tax=Apiotrichum porosum TaxID=105984 RepID=A0A427Y6W9_9TREE|nr:uncharacterized protein EHS24_005112 [Apiotrichum porosum]RSH86837.1 hypothetical protein EHS24_005112 [Apiotrichum porosum]
MASSSPGSSPGPDKNPMYASLRQHSPPPPILAKSAADETPVMTRPPPSTANKLSTVGPANSVCLDHRFFPHLMDNILLHREAWLPMRATSKHYRDMVDLMPHGHLVFAVEIEYLAYSAEDSAEDCTQCRYCGGTRFPWSFDYSIDDDSSDDEEEPCVCRETTYGLDRIVHFDISTPHHKLPGIHPRPYDASSSELVNGTTAAAVKALVKKAHILDLPLGLAEADLDWLQSEAENIEIVRKVDPEREQEFLEELKSHNLPKREWNGALTRVIRQPFLFRMALLAPPRDFTRLRVGQETDLSKISLATPNSKAFTDVPMQMALVQLVLSRKHGAMAAATAPRRGIGTHIPDLATVLRAIVAGESGSVRGLLSFVGELKVTRLENRSGKHVVIVSRKDDPELAADGDDGWDEATHYSLSSSASADESRIAQVDGRTKWSAGMSKTVVYLQSAYEFCGTVLATFHLGSRYSRLLLLSDGDVAVECNEAFLTTRPGRTLSMVEFLQDEQSLSHLAWDLCASTSSELPILNWDEGARHKLLDIVKLSIDIIVVHMKRNPSQPFCRLPSLATLGLNENNIPHTLKRRALKVTLGDQDKAAVLESSRPLRTRKRKSEPSLPLAAKSDQPPPEDDSEGGHEKKRSLGRDPNTGGRQGDATSSVWPGVTRSQASPAATSSRSRVQDEREEHETSILNSKVGVWLHGIEDPATSSVDSSPNTSLRTPEDAEGDTTALFDNELSQVRCAQHMCQQDANRVANHVASDSDFGTDEDIASPTAQELLQAIGEKGIIVTLVDSATMDSMLAVISSTVSQWQG